MADPPPPVAPTAPDPLAFRVFNEIGIIEHLSRTLFERVMPDGLTVAQFSVLNHFVRLGGERSPARLAAAFQVTKATMSSTLARLERGGYVTVRPDARDGRAKRVAITPRGVATRHACVAALGPVLARLEALVPEAELAALLPGLVRLRERLDTNRETLQDLPAASGDDGRAPLPHRPVGHRAAPEDVAGPEGTAG